MDQLASDSDHEKEVIKNTLLRMKATGKEKNNAFGKEIAMAIDGVLGPANGPLNTPNAAAGGQTIRFSKPPTSVDAIPAWGAGIALGQSIAEDWLEKDASIPGILGKLGLDEEGFKEMIQELMCNIAKPLGEATKYLKAMDDEEGSVKGLL